MAELRPGSLVTVPTAGPDVDGIVFATPSDRKTVVAVVDPRRGPGMRSVDPHVLTERTEPGPHDPALQALIRRTPPASLGGQSSSTGTVQGRRGHARAATHRTTGK